ncbi:unnamed protein product [Closterium sp. Naga37s-1]|nr:unnamed protein product [Closterium sp. Naga37s-1]
MFGSQPIEGLLGAPDGPNSVSTSVCTSSAVTAAAAAACCLPRRRSISTIDRSPSSDAAPRCSTRAAIIGRSVRRAAAETFQLTSLTVQLLQFLGLGLNWMSKFFLLMTYSLLLMPGFLQVMWYYFFSPNVRRSIPYGRLPRNSLDIFVPASPSPRPRPVVIFITGGAWIIGYKAWGTLLAQALEERGVIVASIDYRNFPQATVSGMLDDVTRGIGWVLQNIHRYGGDPSRVHLAGQSAGAHLSSVAMIRQALMRASEAPPSEQQHNLSPFGSNLQQPQQQHQQQEQKQQQAAMEGESSCTGVVVSVAETAAGKTAIRYPSVSLAPFAPAAASAKVHPVDAWRISASASPESAAVTISDVPVTSFSDSGYRAPAAFPVLATCADSGLPASPSPLPAAAVFPPVASAGSPADPQAAPAAEVLRAEGLCAEVLRAGNAPFRSLSMRRLLAHLAGSGGAEGNEPGRGVLDVWGSEQINSFIGVSGCYNLINLAPQFESRGMNPYLFLSIFEGEEALPLFSPELLVSRPTFKAAASLLPPVHLYHGVDDISVPFTASEDFGAALQTSGVETRVKLYSGKGHIDLTLQDLFRGGRDELVEDILDIVHGVDRHSPVHTHSHQSDSATSATDHAAEAASPARPARNASTGGAVSASQATAAMPPGLGGYATFQGSIPAAVIVPGEVAAQCPPGQCCVAGETSFSYQDSEKLTAHVGDGMHAAAGGWLPRQGMQGPVAVGRRAESLGPERKWMVPKVLLSAAKFISPF